MTSFTDDQLRPVQPTTPEIAYNSNVRHVAPSTELADAVGVVKNIIGNVPGQRQIGVAWNVEGQVRPVRHHDETELVNVD